MNPSYFFRRMNQLINEFTPSRERTMAAVKLKECEMWLKLCTPTQEALERDQMGSVFSHPDNS